MFFVYLKTFSENENSKRIFYISFDIFRDYGLKNIFFRHKNFLFFEIEIWNFQHFFEIKFCETSHNFNSFSIFRQLLFSLFSLSCLIELKFCENSQNSFSNRGWKFRLSILKKKVLYLRKYSLSQYQNKKALLILAQFSVKVLWKPMKGKRKSNFFSNLWPCGSGITHFILYEKNQDSPFFQFWTNFFI